MENTNSELEALRLERAEKARLVAEKRKQLEELRRRRQIRAQQDANASAGLKATAGTDGGLGVDNLVREILGGATMEPEVLQKLLPTSTAAIHSAADADGKDKAAGEEEKAKGAAKLHKELKIATVDVEPTDAEIYDKSVQTSLTGDQVAGGGDTSKAGAAVERKMPTNILRKMADKARNRVVHGHAPPAASEREKKPLTPEECASLMTNSNFNKFFDRASLLVERALGQQSWDIAADFKSDLLDRTNDSQDLMKHVEDFAEDKWSRNRPVTDVRFSPHNAEMFLAAYGQRSDPEISDSDGCMLVWNCSMKSRPEMAFTCPSEVLTAHFDRFHPALFYGGTYTGGIVHWDARATTGPVLRTPLSKVSHAHPVQAMEQVGTKNATNLVTASNNGRLCSWSLAMPYLPQSNIDLENKVKQRRTPSIMCLAFPESETNILYVGCEDGSICQVHMTGSKAGVTEMYEGHEGPVSGIHMHPVQLEASQYGVDNFADLAVSCSFDWSVKLWSAKQYHAPVLSLDFEDYVYDVKWHPKHPAIFAAVSGEGNVDVWNLNENIEGPAVRCESSGGRKLAMNRCGWSIDGRRLVTGDSEGTVAVYGTDARISQPLKADFVQFAERAKQWQPIVPRAAAYGEGVRFAPIRGAFNMADTGAPKPS